jgi:aldehyde dehydrogenase (NAD+)
VDVRFEHRLLIDGRLVEGEGGLYDNVSPTTGKVIGLASDATPGDAERAVNAARRAFDETDWREDHDFRRNCLQQLQDALRRRSAELVQIQVLEVGMTTLTAAVAVGTVIENMSFMIELADSYGYETTRPVTEVLGTKMARFVRHEPYGVAGLVSPWNAPFLTNIWKLTPALAAGNTAVLKAAPATPWSATVLGEIFANETDMPAGVANVLTAKDPSAVGESITGDPRVDMIHFTGSPAVGERIMQRAAVGLRKVALELGGKSANVILDDADLDAAIGFSAFLCCTLSGQGCALPTRLLLPDGLYDEGVDRVTAAFEAMTIGDPSDPATTIGPIVDQTQLDRIDRLVTAALDAGAKATTGAGKAKMEGDLAGGFWYRPTVLIDVDPQSVAAQSEIFGPVLTVLRYSSDDEAVAIANGTPYGLAGYVQGRDVERAQAIARRLRAGSIGINGTATWMCPDLPFGGYGISGLGREHGIEGFEEYLQSKAVTFPADAL